MKANKQKILIVDDVLANVTILAEMLHDDYDLLMANNGLEAIERIKTNLPDLILLDIVMPEMDGYEVCKYLKKNSQTQHIPIIFITVKNNEGDEEKGLKLGSIDYISRPFNREILKERVKNHLLLKWQSDQLAEAKRELEKRVTERTAELNAAKDLAEFANSAKSTFLRTMSHEIKTPLNAVYGMNQLMHQTELNEEQKDCMNVINESCESLISMVNDVLDFATLDADKMTIEVSIFNFRKMIEDATSKIASLFKDGDVELLINIDEKIPNELNGDSVKLINVMSNLLDNACKFTKKGKIEILLEVVEEKDEQIDIRFAVKDSGIGISKESQQNIFNVFVQADGKTTRQYSGTGLGLSLSQKLVNLMGGKIEFESEESIGSNFYFSLPFGLVK
ncbi:MAG: response regulator [Methylococcales bacterium]|jgi:signal transduction histidine kinase|nr:response regulator [Methylococcales bacterium]MBT7410668.1 response regulator [Methylococcales bacterium]